MPVQTQNAPDRRSPFSEETEEKIQQIPQPKRSSRRKPLMIAAAVLLCTVCYTAGSTLRSASSDPFKKTAPAEHLSLPDYVFIDYGTGEPVQESSIDGFVSGYTFSYSIYNYETARGLRIGDDWDTFVEKYGDVIANSITVDDAEVLTDTPLTVREFDEQYIKTGLTDPTASDIEIVFMTGTDGSDLLYTEGDLLRAKDKYEHTPWLFRSLSDKYSGSPRQFRLVIQFSPSNDGAVDFIYTDMDNYY